MEVLEDPDGMAKQIVREIIAESHVVDDENDGKEPCWHKRSSPLHRRVRRVGEVVLQAAQAR